VYIKRPKTKTKRCAHCMRRRLAKYIEWHPGILEWQCSNFTDCDAAMDAQGRLDKFRANRAKEFVGLANKLGVVLTAKQVEQAMGHI